MSTIKLYINTTENERIDKSSYIAELTSKTVSGTFKNPVDILNPTVQFELPISDLGKYNYMYISDFGRYYFITGWTMISGATYSVSDSTALFEITSHVDVLYTYKTKITANTGLIRRQASQLNPFYIDREIPFMNTGFRTYLSSSLDPFSVVYDSTDADLDKKVNVVSVLINNKIENVATVSAWSGEAPFVQPNPYLNTLNMTRSAYAMTWDQVQAMYDYLNSNSVPCYLFGQTYEGIASVRAYPFDIYSHDSANLDSLASITLGNFSLGTVQGRLIKRNYNCIFDCGSISLVGLSNGDFRDFEPYTSYELYLPYCGFVSLDASDISENTIQIKYAVDLITGDCEAIVTDYYDTSLIYKTAKGKMGLDCPVSNTNQSEIARNLILSGLSLATSASTGTPDIMSLMNAGVNVAINPMKHTGSLPSSGISLCMPSKPILIVSQMQSINMTDYASVKGYACEKSLSLSSLSGYTEVEKIHLENMDPATKTETEEIISLLSNGVIM